MTNSKTNLKSLPAAKGGGKNVKSTRETKSIESKESTGKGMHSSQLMKLFEDELKDIYWAEKALTKAMPKIIKKATSEELIDALTNHSEETDSQVSRLEEVFDCIGKRAVAKKCEAMDGLIKEADEIIKNCEEGAMRDAGIISAAQKIEHYEIATYGTLRQFAETLELTEAAAILEEILEEEKAADEKLSEVATSAINIEAMDLEDEDEDENTEKKAILSF